ncbi:hypothetical protein OSSY52_09220 [Tepiditoga spiralis]|uniref:Glycoside-hydrolase family GH114 TIM-barrel domain-containing protein n=1 Tax=Tepiditoga spiralis TaxID=2108365 RepID=A0A7G1G345_9BACT|nr:hypothetical protein [Tepiditoga spiralis]BBE30781.1 hypothetical protein OSSY52_09220 [Tepiditoga spiralis]
MKKALIYYGYPSCINEYYDINKAINSFKNYDLIVFPGSKRSFKSIEFESHEDHEKSKTIIKNLKNESFGYIACGNRDFDSHWTLKEINKLINLWKEMGVYGIFLDEFGNDYGNDDDRRKQIIDLVHENKLSVIMNVWNPDDVFKNLKTSTWKSDYYLLESFSFYANGEVTLYQTEEMIFERIIKLQEYKKKYDFQILGIDTFGFDFEIIKEEFLNTSLKLANFLSLDAYGVSKKDYHILDTKLIDFNLKNMNFNKTFKLKKSFGKYKRTDLKGKYIKWKNGKFGGIPIEIKI